MTSFKSDDNKDDKLVDYGDLIDLDAIPITIGSTFKKKETGKDKDKDKHMVFTQLVRENYKFTPVREYTRLNKKQILYYEQSDRIIVPSKILAKMGQNIIALQFKIRNARLDTEIFAGIGEFCDENKNEKTIYLPDWMIKELKLERTDVVRIVSVNLNKATKVKALVPEYIKDPKPVLEYYLKNHSTLYLYKPINIKMFDKVYSIRITELEPNTATSIIDSEPHFEIEFDK